ncbi:MAG: TIR domain-containing protein [Chloroflexota bacterium]
MSHFFISYQRDSKEIAWEVKRKIETIGENLLGWIDEYIPLGDDWKYVIDTEIKNSLAVIVVVTVKALESPYVTYEWSYALGLGKRVISLVFEKPDPSNPKHPKIHPKLDTLNWADFTDENKRPWDKLIQELSQIQQQVEIPPLVKNAEIALQQATNPSARRQIIETLRDYEHPAAIEALARAVEFPLPDMSIYAAFSLASRSNYLDERALPGLERAIARSNTRDEGLSILVRFNNAEAVNSLARVGEKAEQYIPGEIILAMAKITDTSVIPELRKTLMLPGTKYTAVIEALGNFKDPQSLPELLFYLEQLSDTKIYGENTEGARAPVIKALGMIGSSDAVEAIGRQLKMHLNGNYRDDIWVVDAAVNALQNIETMSALEILEECAKLPRRSNQVDSIANAIDNLRQRLNN